jgi:regulator of RNase E activity RraB
MEFKDTQSQLEGIREIFETARTEDGWNMDEEMLYSYFFVHTDVDKLDELGNELEKQGYDYIDVFELGDEATEEPTGEYLLHIDRVERHTPESLAQRNVEFQNLADERGVSYDGWEFGEIGDDDDE